MLRPLRWILILCTAVLIAAGVAVAFPLEDWARDVVWTGVPIAACAILLLLALYLANAPRGVVKAGIRVEHLVRMVGVEAKDLLQKAWRLLWKRRSTP